MNSNKVLIHFSAEGLEVSVHFPPCYLLPLAALFGCYVPWLFVNFLSMEVEDAAFRHFLLKLS